MAKKRPLQETPQPPPSESEEEDDSRSTEPDGKEIPSPQKDAVESGDSGGEENDDNEEEIQDPLKDSAASYHTTDSTFESDRPSIEPIQTENSPPPTKSAKSGSKRQAEPEPVRKESVIQRIFSEDDEVALLEGISDFQAREGSDPYADIAKFHDFIKNEIHFNVNVNQLKQKIRRLKNKYKNVVKKSGEDPVFSKPHDLRLFNLSKKIWGSENANEAKRQKGKDEGVESREDEGKKRKKVVNGEGMKKEVVDFSVKFPLCVGGLMEADGLSVRTKNYYLQNLGLIGKAKLEEYEAKLEQIKLAELELCIQRRKLVSRKLRLLCDAYKRCQ